jgi:hypothetical protein
MRVQGNGARTILAAAIFAIAGGAIFAMTGSASSVASAQNTEPKLAGNWSGDSICLDRQSACHDEKVVYRITLYPDDAARVKIQGDKIVNGQPVTMGVGDYKWDRTGQTLTHDDQFGAWKITVKENTMDGIMTSPAGKPFRHLMLKKEE